MTDRNELKRLVSPEYDVLPHLGSILNRVNGMDTHYIGSAMLEIIELREAVTAAISRIDELERLADGEGKIKPIMWHCVAPDEDRDIYNYDEADYVTSSEGDAEDARESNGFTVTPLYTALPSLSELTSERDALRARVETLEGVLKPFARIADMEQAAPPGSVVGVNVDRLREASQALSPQHGDQP